MQPIRVLNMTRLFDKELLIYSFADIRLKKPARVVWLLYFLILMLIWAVPIFMWLPLNPYTLVLALGVPVGGASLMSKPIWGGKKFFDFLKCQIKYLLQTKIFYDGHAGSKLEDYTVYHAYQVSRRQDYRKLLIMEQRRQERNEKA